MVDILLFNRGVKGEAVSLVHDAGILGEVRICQLEIYRLGVFLFVERILVPYPLVRDCSRRRKHPYLVFVSVILGWILDVFDLHIKVLVELIIQSVVVFLGEKYSGSQALVCDCTETARLWTTEKSHAKERTAVPTFLAFFNKNNELLFISFRAGNIEIVEISDVIVFRVLRIADIQQNP